MSITSLAWHESKINVRWTNIFKLTYKYGNNYVYLYSPPYDPSFKNITKVLKTHKVSTPKKPLLAIWCICF